MMAVSAVKPRCASIAASMPARAALPECSAFAIVPMLRRKPPQLQLAIPIAVAVWCGRGPAAGMRPSPPRSGRPARRATSPVGRPAVLPALEIDRLRQPCARLIGEDESIEHLFPDRPRCSATASAAGRICVDKMRAVVEIERIGERAIGKRRHRRRGLDAGAQNRRGRGRAGILGHMLYDDLADRARRGGKRHADGVEDHGLGRLDHGLGDRLGRCPGHEGRKQLGERRHDPACRYFFSASMRLMRATTSGERLRHFCDQRRQFVAGHRAFDRHARLGGKREEPGIVHGRIEGAAQDGKPLDRKVRRREIGLRRLLPRQHENQRLRGRRRSAPG